MKNFKPPFPLTLVLGAWLLAGHAAIADDVPSNVDNNLFRGWPPAEVAYTFPSAVQGGGGVSAGKIDTVSLHVGYIESLPGGEGFNWLLGVDWRRIQSSIPASVAIPETLQSAAVVLGFDWRFRNGWRLRLEAVPGIYGDFRDFSGQDVNSPFSLEVSRLFTPNLLLGLLVSVDARRDLPVVAFPGVRWKCSDHWLLSLWIPRPQIEYLATDNLVLFGGASLEAGSYAVAGDFGRRHGNVQLDHQVLDFQEVRLGIGLRYHLPQKLALEIAGGWTVNRSYDFHEKSFRLHSDGAPYVQFSFGLTY